MPIIEVKKAFGLRMSSEAERRDFGIGRHTVSIDELAHWFMQACLSKEDGRAELVPDEDEEGGEGSGELVSPTKEELTALKVDQLKELCVACGVVVPSGNPSKAALADLLLAGQEEARLLRGITLVKGADGVFVQKGNSVPQTPGGSSQAKPDDAPVQKAE